MTATGRRRHDLESDDEEDGWSRGLRGRYHGGRPYTLSENRGNVVVLYFMAAWYATCIPEAQAQARIHEEYGPRGVEVIILDVDPTENERDLLKFKEQCSDAVSTRSRRAGQYEPSIKL